MKLIRNIVVVLALILLGAALGLALGGREGARGEVAQTSSSASSAATRTRPASPTAATEISGAEGTNPPTAAERSGAGGEGAEGEGTWGVVARVADGDTLTVRFDDGREETIRLLDVDTPETVHPNRPEECFGA